MLCLLSAEAYKLGKSKSFYICMASMVSVVFLMYGMFVIADRIERGELENGTGGVVITQDGERMESGGGSIWEQVGIMEMLSQIFSGDLVACMTSIFISIFVIGEHTSGMVKNIVGKGNARGVIFLSKLLVTEAGVIIMVTVSVAATLLAGRMFIGDCAFAGDFRENFLAYTGVQYLNVIALTAVFVLTGELTRNLAAGISLGVGVAVLPVLILTGLDMALGESSISLSRYWMVSRSGSCPLEGITSGYAVETALIAGIWLIAATALGMWHFYRADIR